jgi:hypothetical protein
LKFPSTRDALEALLEGYKLSPKDVDDFIQSFEEDQYLDYKNGAITSKAQREKGKAVIRQYVSAFANSEGGLLVVGVADQPREISACIRGGGPLDRWAESLLVDMAPRLSPPPRIQVVNHPMGPILVVAVGRSPEFVPCIEARQEKFFLRVHQTTFEAPPFLISDLLLGRRQHPTIEISFHADQLPSYLEERTWNPTFFFSAENVGFVTAEQLSSDL